MPIDGSQFTDRNAKRYSLPKDSVVGSSGGPSPAEVAGISRGGGRVSPASRITGDVTGGPVATATAAALGRSRGKARAQRATEKWIPGSGVVSDVPVGYDGPEGAAGSGHD